MDLINNPDLQDLALSVAAVVASLAFSAVKGTEIYRSVIAGREDRIMQYVETGARAAYSAYVRRIKRQKGQLSPAEAKTAREVAMSSALESAREKGDHHLIEGMSDRELEARLESVLQNIKSEAGLGQAAKTSNRAPGGSSLNLIVFMAALSVALTGCAGLDLALDPGQPGEQSTVTIHPGKYESEAIQAWEIWDRLGESGQLPDHPQRSRDADRVEAFRYSQAVYLYSVARIQGRKPRPGLSATIEESTRCVAWYLREAHPSVTVSFDGLYKALRDSEKVPEALRPLLEYHPESS